MKRLGLAACAALAIGACAIAHSVLADTPGSKAQDILITAAGQQKHTFVVFFKSDDQATRAMADFVHQTIQGRSDRAMIAYVDVNNPAEQALVQRFDVARAPMPLLIGVAPNGAITGMFPRKITAEQIDKAFTTPMVAHCLKSMQQGKMVFVCVHPQPNADLPAGVNDFCQDVEFKQRVAVIGLTPNDSSEQELLDQLEVQPNSRVALTALLAPPGVLVGKFDTDASKEEIAAALHKAGKCCDDPNCKHNQAPPARKN